jgi:segregation and condensation protein B
MSTIEPTVEAIDVEAPDGDLAETAAPDAARNGLLPPLEVDDATLRAGIEGVLFIADDVVTLAALSETLGVAPERIERQLASIVTELAARPGGFALEQVAGGWRLLTTDIARPVLERWIIGARHGRLTQAALETLAVIAYRQPIGRNTIGEIRGVNPDGALRSLIARGLVAEVGREDGPGQAVLFGTTAQFLERLGLRALADLPPLPGYLPDGPAPDEPDAGALAALRRRLREGSQRLGGPAPASTQTALPIDDDEDDGGLPAPRAARPRDDEEIGALSDRLEHAARNAMGRLRRISADQAQQAEQDERFERGDTEDAQELRRDDDGISDD